MKVNFAEQAETDLLDIGRYIAADNVEAALQFINKIEDVCHETIGRHPAIGRQRDDLIVGLRVLPFKKYLIFYRLQNEALQIVRVLHGSRDIEQVFE